MKIGVISDTHDHLENIKKSVEIFKKLRADVLIHAGDFCSPFVFRELNKLQPECSKAYAVFGNNDGDKVLLTENAGNFCSIKQGILKLELEGRKIAVMHYPDIADELFRSGEFDIVIYGHTHRKRLEVTTDGDTKRIILNPGSCAGYLTDKPTVALIDLKNLSADIISL